MDSASHGRWLHRILSIDSMSIIISKSLLALLPGRYSHTDYIEVLTFVPLAKKAA